MISVRNIAFAAALATAGTANAWWGAPYNGVPANGYAPVATPEAVQDQIKAQQEAFEAHRKAQIEAIEAQRKAAEEYAKNMPEFTPANYAPEGIVARDRDAIEGMTTKEREAIEAFMASEREKIDAHFKAVKEEMDKIRAEREADIEKHRKAREDRVAMVDTAEK